MRKLVFVLALVLASCGTQRVVIVSTNDIHSNVDEFPRLATLVEGLRGVEKHVLLADGGDKWTGNPFIEMAERPLSPIVELMNELDYDVAVLGNHEFDWGQPLLRERIDEADFEVICANLESADSELGPVPPYAIVKVGGMRFAILGLINNFNQFHRPDGKAEHFVGLSFPDVFETAREYAWLKDRGDVFVGLTHIGYEPDLLLAERVPELDLIIGGHSHTVVEDAPTVGHTLVTQTGGRLEYAGVTTVTKRRRDVTIENRLVKLDTIPASPRYAEMVRRINNNPAMKVVLGRAAEPFSDEGVENFVADAVREGMGADVAFYHAGGVRVDKLSGDFTVADLYRIEPFLSGVFTLEMTRAQIEKLLLDNFRGPDGTSRRTDIIPGGVSYSFVVDESGRAVGVEFCGLPEKEVYVVAVPDYLYKNYPFDYSLPVVETGRMVTELMRTYVVGHTVFAPDNKRRVVIK